MVLLLILGACVWVGLCLLALALCAAAKAADGEDRAPRRAEAHATRPTARAA